MTQRLLMGTCCDVKIEINASKKVSLEQLYFLLTELILSLASPRLILLDQAPVVRVLPGFVFSCSATGVPPIYTAVVRNTSVLKNTTYTAIIRLYQKGNYSCVATNRFGTDRKAFSVIFTGKNFSFLEKLKKNHIAIAKESNHYDHSRQTKENITRERQ